MMLTSMARAARGWSFSLLEGVSTRRHRAQRTSSVASYSAARALSSSGSIDPTKQLPRVVGQDVVFENPWFRLKTIRFLDLKGIERKWTGLERTTTYPQLSDPNGEEKCDAVVVFPFLMRANEPTQAILIRQFRPPVGKWVIELPAGLIDGGEEPEVAATRELYEETGYAASRVLHMGPPMVTDQGLTNGRCRLVLMQVRHEEQQQEKPLLDGLVSWLEKRRETHGDEIDARLY